jgi:hypothetical protein
MTKLIPVDKLLKFTKSKKKYTWRWDHSFDMKAKAKIYINYGYTEKELPEELVITFKYIDSKKNILKNENIESNVIHKIKVPKRKAVGKSEIPISFDIKSGTNILWKISIEPITKKNESYIYFVLSN